MAKKKALRKKLKQPDEFITITSRAIQWGQTHAIRIGIGAAVLVALILAITGYRYVDTQKELKGFALLNQARVKYAGEMAKGDSPEKVYAAVKSDYENILNEYGNRGAGRIARKNLADICFNAKAYDRAGQLYEKSLVDFEQEPLYHAIILSDLAHTYQASHNDEAAAAYFQKIIALPNGPSKDEALFDLAGIYEKQGKPDKALALYKQINAEFADSIYINIVKEKIAG